MVMTDDTSIEESGHGILKFIFIFLICYIILDIMLLSRVPLDPPRSVRSRGRPAAAPVGRQDFDDPRLFPTPSRESADP